jgi:hypothetical protein
MMDPASSSDFESTLVSTRATPSYSWSCHACDASNPPGVGRCVSCGFPAVAPGRKIVQARLQARSLVASDTEAATTVAALPSTPSIPTTVWEELAAQPPARRVAVVAILSMLATGTFLFKFAMSLKFTLLGLGLVALGFAWLALLGKPQPAPEAPPP